MTWLPQDGRTLTADLVAGVTLAAIAIPECMGYTKIVGTPVVTGLYTILMPLLAFAVIGSSRYLVIGADSATAAILFSGLTGLAVPLTAHWTALTSAAALMTAVCLGVACLFRLGFLADFLSRTVLVGFLSGVGVSLVIAQLPDMFGLEGVGLRSAGSLMALPGELSRVHWPAVIMTSAVIAAIIGLAHVAPRAPGTLISIALAIAATWMGGLEHHGIAIVGPVTSGLPHVQFPTLTRHEAWVLLPTCASMFLVIVAQSAATARSFAQQAGEQLDENRDLLGLTAANVLAGVSGTFVVNGSPTKTAIAAAAGARSQLAQVTTAVVVLVVLLVATPVIAHVPVPALAALVGVIGVNLIDVRALRQIYRFRTATFGVAMATLAAVVWFGVERGIFIAIVLSVLDHLRQEYHPKDVVLTTNRQTWISTDAATGVETEPGLIVYRFQAPLFFANADYFSARVRHLVRTAPHPVTWFVLDLLSMHDIDYTGGFTLVTTIHHLQQLGVTVALAGAADVTGPLEHLDVIDRVGRARVFDSVHEAVDAYQHRQH